MFETRTFELTRAEVFPSIQVSLRPLQIFMHMYRFHDYVI